jgi:hypothetical protein
MEVKKIDGKNEWVGFQYQKDKQRLHVAFVQN